MDGHSFVPYSRRGAAAAIGTGAFDKDGRAQAAFHLVATARSAKGSPSQDHVQACSVLGPGDVVGIDKSQIIRMSPGPARGNHEPNYLAHIEFAHPDFPWLFSPCAPNAKHQLQPWLALVVFEEPDGAPRVSNPPGSPNPVVAVDASQLPDLNEAWAWAHVQVANTYAENAAATIRDFDAHRGLVLSRILSPRKLEPNRHWVACLVPTFATGVAAGLGRISSQSEPMDPQAPAWTRDSKTVTLPVYHHWRFGTGPAGDFETLAQKLKGVKPIAEVGQRIVHLDPKISRLGESGLFKPISLPIGTALAHRSQPGELSPLATPGPKPDVIGARLKALLNAEARKTSEGEEQPVVGPPIYGQWPAQRRLLDDTPENPLPTLPKNAPWITELNADPEMRAVAALGARMVQHDQEELMAAAWWQLQAVAEANRRARWGQIFLSMSIKLHERRIAPRTPVRLLQAAAPALGRLRVSPTDTIATQIRSTALPMSVIGGNFFRIGRSALKVAARTIASAPAPAADILGPLAVRMLASQVTPAAGARFGTTERLKPEAFGELLRSSGIAEDIEATTGLSLEEHVSKLSNLASLVTKTEDRLQIADVPATPEEPTVKGEFDSTFENFHRLGKLVLEKQATQPQFGKFYKRVGMAAAGGPERQALQLNANEIRTLRAHWKPADAGAAPDLSSAGVRLSISKLQMDRYEKMLQLAKTKPEAVSSAGRFAAVRSAVMAQFLIDRPIAPAVDPDLLISAADALDAINARLTSPDRRPDLGKLEVYSASAVKAAVTRLLSPTASYGKMLAWAAPLSAAAPRAPRRRSPAHEIMATPHFFDPAAERLKRLDKEWILGRADKLPANSISIFAINRRFVEAFLVGANHEMARELQWRRYPCDLAGASFTRFWPAPPNAQDDIAQIADWTRALGGNGPAAASEPPETAVIVVRGELLRLYPNTSVTAMLGRIEESKDGLRFIQNGPAVRELFRDTLDPDITFSALDIGLEKLKSPPDGELNRWFIAFTQPMDEPKFGLDDSTGATVVSVESVDDLSWQSLPSELIENGMLRVASQTGEAWPQPKKAPFRLPGETAGEIASVLFQRPFQLLLEARDYL